MWTLSLSVTHRLFHSFTLVSIHSLLLSHEQMRGFEGLKSYWTRLYHLVSHTQPQPNCLQNEQNQRRNLQFHPAGSQKPLLLWWGCNRQKLAPVAVPLRDSTRRQIQCHEQVCVVACVWQIVKYSVSVLLYSRGAGRSLRRGSVGLLLPLKLHFSREGKSVFSILSCLATMWHFHGHLNRGKKVHPSRSMSNYSSMSHKILKLYSS